MPKSLNDSKRNIYHAYFTPLHFKLLSPLVFAAARGRADRTFQRHLLTQHGASRTEHDDQVWTVPLCAHRQRRRRQRVHQRSDHEHGERAVPLGIADGAQRA